MFNFLREVRILQEEGSLHKKLINRVRMLLVISVVLVGITLFNVVYRDSEPVVAAGLLIGGLVVGLFVFSRMNVIQWNEELEVVEAGRMDIIGYGVLALYIISEISLRTLLRDAYPVSGTTFILAAVAGTLLGRAIGTVIEIHRVFKSTHGGA